MSKQRSIKATDITSEAELAQLLQRGGLSSMPPGEVVGVSHWWVKEFRTEPPLARQVTVVGNEDYAPYLYLAVQEGKFVVYRLDEQNYWFNRLGEIEEFSTDDEISKYLTDLVNQDLANWKEWMKRYRGIE